MPQPAGKQHRYTYTATAALCTRTQRHLPQMQWAFCRPEGAHTVNATHTWHSSNFTTCSREQRWNEHFEFLYLKQVNVHCTQREKDNFHAKRQHLLRFGEGLFTLFINEQITHREEISKSVNFGTTVHAEHLSRPNLAEFELGCQYGIWPTNDCASISMSTQWRCRPCNVVQTSSQVSTVTLEDQLFFLYTVACCR